jgi:large subunit ribosomal protein L7/L12
MSQTTNEILTKLKTLTLLEAAELVSQIEETFGVDARSPISRRMGVTIIGGIADSQTEKARQTSFDVVLESVAEDKRVASLKAIRSLTDLGLKEAKRFCSDLPKNVKEGISKEEAEKVKEELEQAGGTVVIK